MISLRMHNKLAPACFGALLLGLVIGLVFSAPTPQAAAQGLGNCSSGFIHKEEQSPYEYSTSNSANKAVSVIVKAGSQNQGQACFSLNLGNYTSSWQYVDNGCYKAKWKMDGSFYKVVVWKIGSGSSCKDISHVEFYTGQTSPTPTPTTVQSTPSPTPTTVQSTPTPTSISTPTPTPSEGPQCKPEPAECTVNNSEKECCEGLVCVPNNPNSGNGKCRPAPTPTPTPGEEVTPTPTPGDEVTPTPTPIEEMSPTPTPVSEVTPTPVATSTPGPTSPPSAGRTSAIGYNANCESNDIEVTYDVKKEDGSGEKDVEVRFNYQENKQTAKTNENGRARVFYAKNGDGSVKAEADGYASQSVFMNMPTCPAPSVTPGVGGQVLGASTGKVLGATSYAKTGTSTQSIFTVAQLLGMLMIVTGAARYVKETIKV